MRQQREQAYFRLEYYIYISILGQFLFLIHNFRGPFRKQTNFKVKALRSDYSLPIQAGGNFGSTQPHGRKKTMKLRNKKIHPFIKATTFVYIFELSNEFSETDKCLHIFVYSFFHFCYQTFVPHPQTQWQAISVTRKIELKHTKRIYGFCKHTRTPVLQPLGTTSEQVIHMF